jgi:hypothetical protein
MSMIRAALVPALALVLLVACTSAAATPTVSSLPSVDPSPTASPEPTMSPEPSPSASDGAALDSFEYTAIFGIDVDNLAVRRAPFTSVPLATAYRNGEEIGEARLDAGDFVSVELGPLQLGDITWYRVFPAEDGQLMSSSIQWDTKNDGPNPIEPGWIATAEGDSAYATLSAPAADDGVFEGLPLLVSGSGDFVSTQFEGFDLYLLTWAFAIDDTDAPCDFHVELAEAEGSASVTVHESSTIGAFEEGVSPIGAGDRSPIVGDDFVPLVMQIRSGCEWSVRLEAQPHD